MTTAVQEEILRDRFYHEGETSWEQVCERVADAWADPGQHREDVYEMLVNRRALPNTPAIANAGRPNPQGSACFVLPVNDSLTDGPASIMQTLMDAAAVHKSGGGTGFSFGRIRGRGELVRSTGREAPGAVNVMELYSDAIARVTQAGMRPGANMGILPVDHPDIIEFLACKRQEGRIRNFNISVAVTDAFMSDPDPEVWEAIVDGAWRNGEPGVIFIDTINDAAPHPERIEATNPCGEVPLLPYEACVLGSVNLAAHIDEHGMDFDALSHTTRTLTRLLDNIIDRQTYPIPEIERGHRAYRKIGVGVMGYADALVKLGVVYGGPMALDLAEEWMAYVSKQTHYESLMLGMSRGQYQAPSDTMPFRRNLCTNVIAPTGTISRLAGCSFGIEPIFAAETVSHILDGKTFMERHPLADHKAFVTAEDITPEQHVAVQAAFQEHTDQAVSKTVNLPHDATREDVARIYRLAWESGCKGITVYRAGSRDAEVISKAHGECVSGVCEL